MKEPYYLVSFNSSICNYEIFVNDMPAYLHHDGGSMSSQYPINHLILEKGKQNIQIRILPLKGEAAFRKDAFIKIKVFYYDASTTNYETNIEVFKFEEVDFSKIKLPIIEVVNGFLANVPYKIVGWQKAQEIKDKKNEIITFYKEIFELFKQNNIEKIFQLSKRKYEEMDKATYLENEDNKNGLKILFNQITKSELVLQNFPTKSTLIIYNNKKVCSLTRENGEPILHFVNKKTNNEFSLPVFVCFENDKLIIIR